MKLDVQKRLAAKALKCSYQRIRFDPARLSDIKEAITLYDIRSLINSRAISKIHKQGISRGRARAIHIQKVKGRQRGHGSRKGRAGARLKRKDTWMNRIRLQRGFIKSLKDSGKIKNEVYRSLYLKAKGGFFRSKRHVKLYMEENKLI